MTTGSSRSNTRQRIQDVAIELFAEHGYEKTSLREIAERLGVTKAALYYHFKTKEDILITLFEDLSRPMDELVEWGKDQPRTLETKKEILTRYSEALTQAAPLFRFMQENQATIRDLSLGDLFKKRMIALAQLLTEPDADLTDQVRGLSAISTMHAGHFVLPSLLDATPLERSAATLQIAHELITAAHEHAADQET